MKNILWLTAWWPNDMEPFSGDGIERRAKAASLYNNITVIFIKKNPALKTRRIKLEEKTYNENLRAWIFYYPSITGFFRFFDIIYSNYWFIRLHNRGLKTFKKKYGKPHTVQVNVAMKTGIIALMWRWFKKIQYIIVEGWSLFLPEAKPSLKDESFFFRVLTRKVLGNAVLLVTVSKHLGEMINKNVLKVPYKVIPSTVDKTIFYPSTEIAEPDIFRFIHISTLDNAKNIKEILLALRQVLDLNFRVELIIHAPPKKELDELIKTFQLKNNVTLRGEMQQIKLAESIRSCDALVLFSLYETFGNVVIEAQACGLPVITSDYPTFSETVVNWKNGIIANGKKSSDLCSAMVELIKNKNQFNKNEIAENAKSCYSFERIGKMLDEVYKQYF
ncbi:MAG: glycosyltransferase [Bacteroidetes bacterium]|nr:glycosyltransferase [Bacteroidota bacterium]MBS1932167.1 glycosyltransferase [Bacteroidota bacterium]